MYISQQARDLLLAGKFSELQALSYQDLLSDEVRQEIFNIFLNDSFIDTTHMALEDSVALQIIENACVVSSGHIYSESTIQKLLQNQIAANCPNSGQPLVLNIAGQGQAYVRLPRIDTILNCFCLLRAMNQSMSMPETVLLEKQKTEKPPKPETHAFFGCTVTSGRMKLYFDFDNDVKNYAQHLSDYLEFMLPKGKILSGWQSYEIDRAKVGRCWEQKPSKKLFTIILWYPKEKDITFSVNHISQLLKMFSTIFKLPMQEEDAIAINTPCYTLSDLHSKHYVVLMSEIPVSFDQALASTHRFLSYTTEAAQKLGFEVVDKVIQSSRCSRSSTLVGHGVFRRQNDIDISSMNVVTSFSKGV